VLVLIGMGKQNEKTKGSEDAFIPALPALARDQEDIGQNSCLGSYFLGLK